MKARTSLTPPTYLATTIECLPFFRLIRLSIWLCYKFAWIIDSMKQKKTSVAIGTLSRQIFYIYFDEGWMEIFQFLALKNALNFKSRNISLSLSLLLLLRHTLLSVDIYKTEFSTFYPPPRFHFFDFVLSIKPCKMVERMRII